MRHVFRRLLVFIGLGALISIAVAWVSAVVVDPTVAPLVEQQTGERQVGPVWIVQRWSTATTTLVYSRRFIGGSTKQEAPSELVPSWTGIDKHGTTFEAGKALYESRIADGHGWPLRSLWSELDDPFSEQRTARWGIEVPLTTVLRTGGQPINRALPLRPIPLGFLLNSFVMAAALYTPFIAIDLRRIRRWRRQQCLLCGYPIGRSPLCTECGRPVAARPVSDSPDGTSARSSADDA